MLNTNLSLMLDWADSNGIELDNAQLNPRWRKIYFYHENETAQNMRTVKRAVGGFKTEGRPPYLTLEAKVEHAGAIISVQYEGAMQCNVSYNCTAAKFADGTSMALEPEPA